MRVDITRLPVGEMLIGFLLAALAVTFVGAFVAVEDGGGEKEGAVMAASPAPQASPMPETPPPGAPPLELVRRGQQIAAASACFACHSTTGQVIVGPSWKGIFGEPVTLSDGTAVIVDDAYIRQSILNPPAKVVEGFNAVMPSFSAISEEDIRALIAFIQSLK